MISQQNAQKKEWKLGSLQLILHIKIRKSHLLKFEPFIRFILVTSTTNNSIKTDAIKPYL